MDGAVGPVNSGDALPDASGNGNTVTMQGGGQIWSPASTTRRLQSHAASTLMAARYTPPSSSLNSWTDSVWFNMPASALSSYHVPDERPL